MKNLLSLLIVICFCFSCSKDDNSSSNSDNPLNPPVWLHGSWENKLGDSTMLELEVTSNNIKIISLIGTVYDIAGQIEAMESAPNSSIDIEETIVTDDSYEFTMTVYVNNSEQLRVTYGFDRVNSETIDFSQNSGTAQMKRK